MNNKPLRIIALYALFLVSSCGIVCGQGSRDNTLLMKWRCSSGGAVINFNPAVLIDSSSSSQNALSGMVFDSLPYAADYTAIIVSRPLSNHETRLWHLEYGDSTSRSLTTETIHCGTSAIRYSDSTRTLPAIFTLSQSAPDSTSPFVRMLVGGQPQEVAEIRYYAQCSSTRSFGSGTYSGRMGVGKLRKVQSELAIRYGITLGPVDYLSSDGIPVWNHKANEAFHHRITALAADSVYGLRQLCSRSEMENPFLTISTDSMNDGTYLVIGDDASPMEFVFDSTGETLSRSWAAQATGDSLPLFTLAFDKNAIPLPNDSIVLMVEEATDSLVDVDLGSSAIYHPSSNAGGIITFSGVQFPKGTSHFTLCRGSVYWMQTRSKRNEKPNTGVRAEASVSIYPNPTTGHYRIDLSNCESADITIFNALGEVIDTRHIDGTQNHIIEGFLPVSGEYYVTVTTPDGSHTTKLIVKR